MGGHGSKHEAETALEPPAGCLGIVDKEHTGEYTFPSGLQVDHGATVAGLKSDQDRYVMLPDIVPGVLWVGVFDGHGGKGPGIPEQAAAVVTSEFIKLAKDTVTTELADETASRLMIEAFLNFQKMRQDFYDKNILRPALKAKAKAEKAAGIKMPFNQPQEGGTTASVLAMTNNRLHAAWVGDSKVVLGTMRDGAIVATDISTEHNVSMHPEELKRAIAAGGGECGKYIAVNGAEGMMQLLRSLGDCGFHQHDVVLADPETRSLDLSEDDLYVIAASDGVWGALSSQDAVQTVHDSLIASNYVSGEHAKVKEACLKLQEAAEAKTKELKQSKDDISIVILILRANFTAQTAV